MKDWTCRLYKVDLVQQKGDNLLLKFNVGVYSEPWGVRALTIIDYWSRGPKATFIFMPPPLFAVF